jgi:alpha-glucosidase
MLLNLGLSGFAFVGSDIGGFAESPSAELFTRWLQLGVFYPFMRDHTAFGTADQEPWAFGARHEQLNRRAIELRYELLPTIYNEMRSAAETGVPAMRPLFLEFPDDKATNGIDDELMFGRDLLVAPVLREAATERGVYLPAGDWYDYWTGKQRAGGGWFSQPVTIESLPIYVRGGGFVFRQPVVQHTGEIPGQPLKVFVYPAASSSAELYEDDGETMGYARGAFMRRRFTAGVSTAAVTLEIAPALGTWRPAARDLEIWIRRDGATARVTIDGAPAPAGSTRSDGGFLVVTLRDRFDGLRLAVE